MTETFDVAGNLTVYDLDDGSTVTGYGDPLTSSPSGVTFGVDLLSNPAITGEVVTITAVTGDIVVAGPRGPAGPSGARGGILNGTGAPPAGSGLDPLDGVNDPWRWHAGLGGWVSPAYSVTYNEGDHLAATPAQGDSSPGSGIYIVVVDDLTSSGGDWSPVLNGDITDPAGGTTVPFVDDSDGQTYTPGVAVRAGTGYAFAVLYESGYTGPTAVPVNLDVIDYLGTDVTYSTKAHVWPDVTFGADGDFYIDTAAWNIYGPKASGLWPAPVSLIGPAGP